MKLIQIPCEDGSEYDLYVVPPGTLNLTDALKFVEEAIEAYFGSSGEKELIPALEAAGFELPEIYKTEGTW